MLICGTFVACDLNPKDKPKARWLYGVINRNGNVFKVLDIGWSVFSDIKKLAKNVQRWGDPTKYDINIIVDPDGGPTSYYSVQPLPKEPLSAADQQIKDKVDLEDLRRRSTPPTPDYVQKRIDKILGEGGAQAAIAAAHASKSKVTAKATAVTMTDDEELSGEFPDYDNQ